jgi:predicted nucleic acid-binding protein
MSVLVDTGVFFAHHDTDAERHDAAVDAVDDHGLSFTDATLVAQSESRGIDAVLSFDADFDGLVDRIEPGR